jgi:hypothetical protein
MPSSLRGGVLLAGLAMLGCTGAGTTSDGGSDATVAVCPSAAPANGASCSSPGLGCEYVSSSGELCSTFASCGGTPSPTWDVVVPPPHCGVNGPDCPASYTALAGGLSCPLSTSPNCTYPEGVCACTPCVTDGGASTEWTCRAFPPSADECPWPRPVLGSACTNEGALCWYACCEAVPLGPDMVCRNGAWTLGACTAFCQATPQCSW